MSSVKLPIDDVLHAGPPASPLVEAVLDLAKERVRAKFAGGQFPRLLTSDSMVQFLGMPVGSIISVREVFGREQPVTTHFEVSEI